MALSWFRQRCAWSLVPSSNRSKMLRLAFQARFRWWLRSSSSTRGWDPRTCLAWSWSSWVWIRSSWALAPTLQPRMDMRLPGSARFFPSSHLISSSARSSPLTTGSLPWICWPSSKAAASACRTTPRTHSALELCTWSRTCTGYCQNGSRGLAWPPRVFVDTCWKTLLGHCSIRIGAIFAAALSWT